MSHHLTRNPTHELSLDIAEDGVRLGVADSGHLEGDVVGRAGLGTNKQHSRVSIAGSSTWRQPSRRVLRAGGTRKMGAGRGGRDGGEVRVGGPGGGVESLTLTSSWLPWRGKSLERRSLADLPLNDYKRDERRRRIELGVCWRVGREERKMGAGDGTTSAAGSSASSVLGWLR